MSQSVFSSDEMCLVEVVSIRLKKAEMMNDEWSRCPICFEDYSSKHRPTTFVCGHSTCIDHTIGPQRLQYCPICRYKLKDREVYHVSYCLEEASSLFQQVKDMIDWSKVKRISVPAAVPDVPSGLVAGSQDEIYARQLQAEFDREAQTRPPARAGQPVHQATAVTVERRGPAQPQRDSASGHPKNCGHRCDMLSTTRCCSCSDRRPTVHGHLYPVYVDGRRTENRATRNEWYCPTCKQQG